MNLHAVAGPVVGAINPIVTVQLQTGMTATTAADGTVTPVYSTISVPAQIQALTGKDLRQIASLNLEGTLRAIYFYGAVTGLIRASQTNGTLVTFPDGSNWMVFIEFEPWSATAGWSKVGVVRQNP